MKWIILALLYLSCGLLFVACSLRPDYIPDKNELKALNQVEHLLKFGFSPRDLEILDAESDLLPPIDSDNSDTDNPTLFTPLTQTAPGGAPESFLAANLMESMPLVDSYLMAIGPTDTFAGNFFILDVECSSRAPVTDAHLYFRDNKIVIIVKVDESEVSTSATIYKKRLIGRHIVLPPGDYDVLLVGANESRQWKLKVRSRPSRPPRHLPLRR